MAVVVALVAVAAGLATLAVTPSTAEAAPTFLRYEAYRNFLTGKCLDVAGQDNGAKVQQFTCNGTVNQQWRKVTAPGGHFTLQVASSGLCLQVPDFRYTNDAVVNVGTCNGGFNQHWRTASFDRLIARHSSRCLSVLFESREERAQAVQFACDGGMTQIWTPTFSAEYSGFQRHGTEKCLDLSAREMGSIVRQFACNGTVNQLWERVPATDGYFMLRAASNGGCLRVRDSELAEWAIVDIGECTGGPGQQWITEVHSGGSVRLRVRHSRKCLDTISINTGERDPATQRVCDRETMDQHWINF